MRKLKLFFACLLMAVLSIGQVWAESVTFSEVYANQDKPTSYEGTDFSISFDKNGGNATQYYNTGNALRAYAKNRWTFSSTKTITGIAFTFGSGDGSNTITASTGTYADGSWEGSASEITFSVGGTSGHRRIASVEVTFASGPSDACAAPTFNPAAGAVVSGTTVALSCATEGATIHYTTNGTDPTASSATYTSAITVDENMTIKAIAVKDGLDNSSVASATYTILTPKTIAQVLNDISATEGAEFLLNDVTVTYANGKNVYVKDATGYLMVFSSITGAANGKVLQGLCGKAKLYNGLPEVSSVTKAPTLSDGTAVEPIAQNAYPTDADLNKYVALEDVTFAEAGSFSGSVNNVNGTFKDATLVLRNTFKLNGVSVETGKSYRVVGVVQKYNDAYQVYPITIEEIVAASAPATPTFSVAAGEYTEVKSVELSCETDGATIYYTTDGSTPDNTSTEYAGAITVDEDMTIKAIAFKDELYSATATAAYVINLPVSEEIQKTWNLAIDETATASENELTWTATYVSMSFAKANASTNANNYYPSTPNQTYTSTRAYKNSVITITPNGKQITSIVFEATSSGYATALKNSAWTNATAVAANTTITVTPTNGKNAISAVIGGTCGFTSVQVNYEAISATAPADPTFSVAAGEYTEVKSVELSCETDGATIYYTTDGSTPDNTSTEYTAAITVDENMTIKAIAYLGEEASGVAEAAYVINLPVSEEDQKTWDLSIDETATASADALTWTATYVDMSVTSGTAAANNYYPGTSGKSYTSTRFYNGATLTITPNGKQITSIVIETDGATPFKNATWTNGTATNVDKTVTITVTSPGAVTAVFQANATAFSVQVNYTAIDPTFPVAPVLTPAAGTYNAVQTVEITCETDGATIYYTTDGTAPSSTSTEYTGAITVDEDMTIQAVAINGEKVGPIVTAAYKINLPLTTMDQIFAAATAAGSTATDANIQFNNWVVSGVSTNGKNVFVTDGTKGFIIFDNGGEMGFAVGDVLSGTVACKVQLYNGAAELTTLSSTTEGLNVATGGTVTPEVKAISALSGINTGAAVTINSVQFDGEYLSDGANEIKPYNSLFAYDDLTENSYYNVTGIYQQFGDVKEILPRSAADIEEVSLSDPEISYTPASATIELGQSLPGTTFANPHELAISYSSNNEAVATVSNTGVIALGTETGTAVITASFAGNATYAAANVTYTITVNPASVSENVVILAVYDTKYYAMSTTNASSAFTAIEVEYDGSQVTVNSAEDKAAIQWTKKTSGDNTTFQDADEKYMKGTSDGAAMTLNANVCNWGWDGTSEYYHIGSRTFLYQNGVGFKNYATSNIGKSGYSGKAQVIVIDPANIVITSKVSAELAYDPESDEITEGDAWSAPSLVNPHSVTITSYASDNESVATVEGGVIALAGGIGTAHITAHFDGDASYLEGDAVYTITVNEAGDDLSGTWVLASSVAAGDKIIIMGANNADIYTMGKQNPNNRAAVASTLSEDVLNPGAATKVFTLVDAGEGKFAIQASNGNYLTSATSGTSNNLLEAADYDLDNAKWTITIENGSYSIVAAAGSKTVMQYNSGSTIFSCYGSASQKPVKIFKRDAAPEPPVVDYTEVRNDLTEGWYYTMCLNKAVTAVKAGSIWRVLSKAANGNDVILEEAELPLVAGRPYIFRAAASTLEVAYTGEAVTEPVNDADNNGLVGSFVQAQIENVNTNYIIYNNALYYVEGTNVYVGANRAYLNMLGVPDYSEPQQLGNAPRRRVTMAVHGEQTTTGIDALNAAEAPVKVLINGQMYILRGEKMYNVNGQVVK